MKSLILIFIKLYWKFWSSKISKTCLFRISCSQYIYRVTKIKGSIAGIHVHAFITRFKKCRPGYIIVSERGNIFVQLSDGSIIDEQEASQEIISSYKNQYQNNAESL